MGCGCGKSNIANASDKPLDKSVEINLQTKKEFQKSWETNNTVVVQIDINAIWSVAVANQDVGKVYLMDKNQIGAGHYGVVRKAKLRSDPSKIYAIKSIEKRKLKGDSTLLKTELELLRFSDHPNIIQFYEIYQDKTHFHFVMEYCEGGDITSRVEEDGPFEEEITKKIVFQVLLGLNHLHSCGIIHRDIKPDNFLFKNKSKDSDIKLIDFGLSRRFNNGSKLTSVLGTPNYVAPEVLEKSGYNEKVDIWSTGVMMYLLLAADFPFKGENTAQLFEKIRRAEYSMHTCDNLMKLSPQGKAVLKGLLDRSPNKRFSAREALRDPWFDTLNIEMNEKGKKLVSLEMLNRLRTFNSDYKLMRGIINMLVTIHDDSEQVRRMRDAFFYIDVLDNGILMTPELKKAFTELGVAVTDMELEETIRGLEQRAKGAITYTEFISATIDESFYRNQVYLDEAFKRFDYDQDHYISYDDIYQTFCRFGISLTKKDIHDMIKDFDENNDGKISHEEFMKIMKADNHSSPGKRLGSVQGFHTTLSNA
jgi:calcium-dependent protein kinase